MEHEMKNPFRKKEKTLDAAITKGDREGGVFFSNCWQHFSKFFIITSIRASGFMASDPVLLSSTRLPIFQRTPFLKMRRMEEER
jgi:hypothetical protein